MPAISQNFIANLHKNLSNGLAHALPVSSSMTDERTLVRGVLSMLQGFPSLLFYWDENTSSFHVKDGVYVSHLSRTSLRNILEPFLYSGNCLKKVEIFIKKARAYRKKTPTLEAFAHSVDLWLTRLRDIALKEETHATMPENVSTVTLLSLVNSLSSLCCGSDCLFQVVTEVFPVSSFDSDASLPAAEMAVHIIDHLFEKLNEVCLIEDGEEEAYHMLLAIFTGSLLPYIERINSWLYDGILDDPYGEMFFYANDIAIDQPAFWERSYILRPWILRESKKEHNNNENLFVSSSSRGRDQNDVDIVVPVFLKDVASSIVSAGKSLQLIRHIHKVHSSIPLADREDYFQRAELTSFDGEIGEHKKSETKKSEHDLCDKGQMFNTMLSGLLTLSEVFLVSLTALIGDNCHLHDTLFTMLGHDISMHKSIAYEQKIINGIKDHASNSICDKVWLKFLADVVSKRSPVDISNEDYPNPADRSFGFAYEDGESNGDVDLFIAEKKHVPMENESRYPILSFCSGNPVLTVCEKFLSRNITSWNELNIYEKFHLPPLNDEELREVIFRGKCTDADNDSNNLNKRTVSRFCGTDYTHAFQFGELQHAHLEDDVKALETMFPFPTLLPCFKENLHISELLPFQKNSTLASRVIKWIHNTKFKSNILPAVIIEECLAGYIKDQVESVGRLILSKLTSDWKLMDELTVLRAIYLLGSGDLLQQFLLVIFDRLDKGDSWDDDFELNTLLQESIRNSADSALLSTPDSIIVSISRSDNTKDEEYATGIALMPPKIKNHCFGIDSLDMLKFTYKVSWPLDLIANTETIRKYNQVMGFLLKVKRAKFVLDKTRMWIWKGKGFGAYSSMRQLLVQQKLLHFVDAFHQYVMDRVFHSAWIELCSGMASAGSLDEVIEVHEAYLLTIQRLCFVASDKLWALIASRIKSILGLALDFYTVQYTLSSGDAAPAIKARCEMEVDRIERQFDDCVAFLLRILSFKLNVGQFPHLADLVTRINYNNFYMSESGNLLTIPSFDTATRLRQGSGIQN